MAEQKPMKEEETWSLITATIAVVILFALIGGAAFYIFNNDKMAENPQKEVVINNEATSTTIDTQEGEEVRGGLTISDTVIGSGRIVEKGSTVVVNYTGYFADKTVFDTSKVNGRTPFRVTVGARQVIRAWDEGLIGMKEGGTRVIIAPPEYAYGSSGIPDGRGGFIVPPNTTLYFDIELLSIE